MGEPAPPTKEQRIGRWKLARSIVESVRDDEAMPLGLTAWMPSPGTAEVFDRPAVEQLAFDLAQELELLRDELAVVDSGLDDWDWDGLLAEAVQGRLDDQPDTVTTVFRLLARIAKARKEART